MSIFVISLCSVTELLYFFSFFIPEILFWMKQVSNFEGEREWVSERNRERERESKREKGSRRCCLKTKFRNRKTWQRTERGRERERIDFPHPPSSFLLFPSVLRTCIERTLEVLVSNLRERERNLPENGNALTRLEFFIRTFNNL